MFYLQMSFWNKMNMTCPQLRLLTKVALWGAPYILFSQLLKFEILF